MAEEKKSLSEKREELRERFYDNILVDSVMKLIYDFKKNNKSVIIRLAIIGVFSIYISGIFGEMFLRSQGRIRKIYFDILSVSYGAFATLVGWIFMLAIFIGMNVFLVQLSLLFTKDSDYNKEGNYYKSKRGTQGKAHFLTEAEEENAFHRSKNIMEFLYDVLGMDDFGYMIARRDKEATNDHMAIFGSSGSQKSTALIFILIMQAIRRGESIITTDTKGEMYSLCSKIARLAGYIIKIVNLVPGHISGSDGFDVISIIDPESERAEEDCDDVVESVMLNTNDGRKTDFFFDAESNILSAIVRFVVFSTSILKQDKNLATIYNIIGIGDVEKVAALFKNIKPTHPAYQPFMTWYSNEKTRADALSGLGIRLTKLSSPTVKGLVSHNEIDFSLPGREKCIYFVVLSDRSKTYKFLSSLFLTTTINQLEEYADSLPSKKLPIRTNIIIDEAKASGAIPGFGDYLSTIRSRNLHCKFATQDIGQLEDMYPGNEYKSVLNNCQMQLLLGTSDETTAKHFSVLAGDETVETESKAYEEKRTSIFKIHNNVRVSKGETKRALLPLDDIFHMSNDRMILYVKGEPGVIRLTKMPYYKDFPGSTYEYFNDRPGHNCYYHGYPLMPYIGYDNIFDHVPAWHDEYKKEIESQKNRDRASGEAPVDMGGRRRA